MADVGNPELPFKRLLMLQGPVGPFFSLLADKLTADGVAVKKVNMNAGDFWYFSGENSLNFRGRAHEWPDYLKDLFDQHKFDSLALFGEMRPHHLVALEMARHAGIPVFVFEEGYIRPDFVTVELGGVNGNSSLIRREQNRPAGTRPAHLLDAAVPVGNSFQQMMRYSIHYWIIADAGWIFFRHYRHHKPNAVSELIPWLVSAFRKYKYARRDNAVTANILSSGLPYYFVPLQVHRDSQVVRDSPYLSVGHFIVDVIESFSRHAPPGHTLLFKQHPLDRGHTDYTALIEATATRMNCAAKVEYVRDGHIPTLLKNARATVTINSTVGLSSLIHGTPVKTMGRAIYDQPELTAQCSLDEFWDAPPNLDMAEVHLFVDELIRTCQVNGNFYQRWRRTNLVARIAERMAVLCSTQHSSEIAGAEFTGPLHSVTDILLNSEERRPG